MTTDQGEKRITAVFPFALYRQLKDQDAPMNAFIVQAVIEKLARDAAAQGVGK